MLRVELDSNRTQDLFVTRPRFSRCLLFLIYQSIPWCWVSMAPLAEVLGPVPSKYGARRTSVAPLPPPATDMGCGCCRLGLRGRVTKQGAEAGWYCNRFLIRSRIECMLWCKIYRLMSICCLLSLNFIWFIAWQNYKQGPLCTKWERYSRLSFSNRIFFNEVSTNNLFTLGIGTVCTPGVTASEQRKFGGGGRIAAVAITE